MSERRIANNSIRRRHAHRRGRRRSRSTVRDDKCRGLATLLVGYMPRMDEHASPAAANGAGDERSLVGYTVILGAFAAVFGTSLLAASRGRELPERLGGHDVVLLGLATQKLSRLLAKDKVTSPLRAPFTQFQEVSGHGEVEEKPRGHGARKAIGELLVCPYCLAQWIAAAFAVGMIAAPRLTRLLAAMWASQAVGDTAQLAYAYAAKRS